MSGDHGNETEIKDRLQKGLFAGTPQNLKQADAHKCHGTTHKDDPSKHAYYGPNWLTEACWLAGSIHRMPNVEVTGLRGF